MNAEIIIAEINCYETPWCHYKINSLFILNFLINKTGEIL